MLSCDNLGGLYIHAIATNFEQRDLFEDSEFQVQSYDCFQHMQGDNIFNFDGRQFAHETK